MSEFNCRRPRLLSHYYVLVDPPDSAGDEVLHFISDCRRLRIKGHSFREFQQYVMPLLDGQHTLEEIQAEVADVFASEDLTESLRLLMEHRLLEDAEAAALSGEISHQFAPQLHLFHELSPDPGELQRRLTGATVSVIGLGGAGASVALSLAAARVGTLRCIDHLPVGVADPYLAPIFALSDVSAARAEAVRQKIAATAPQVQVMTHTAMLETDADVLAAIAGSDFVICCVDAAQVALLYKLNRICLQTGIAWTSGMVSGLEVVIGPTVHPPVTACYLCYRMRLVACAENPEDEFAFQRFLDLRRKDDSGQRENLVFATGLAGNLLGMEALRELTGLTPPAALGRIVVLDLLDFSLTKHTVLRKPWCPACSAQQTDANTHAARQPLS